jgi:preprotein translocase subunit SecF
MTDVTDATDATDSVDQHGGGSPRRRHSLSDIYHERTNFQFIDRSWRWGVLSGVLILISVVAFAVNGLNLGIEFDGGTQWQFTRASGSADIDDVRDVLEPLGLGDAKVLILGEDSVRIQADETTQAAQNEVREALAEYAGIEAPAVSVTNVGPTWGDKVSEKALQALVVFFAVLALYLTFRFEFRMAIASLLAVVHDIIITIGVYAVTGFEVTPATVVAFLTILGFSLYDTVVVFDKVKENEARIGVVRGDTYSSMVNRSLNQVLMRSLNTSIVAVLPVASLLFVGTFVLGGQTLKDFALALFVGLLVGAYSSIFVATPILAWLKERQPKYQALRERAAVDLARAGTSPTRSATRPAATPAPVAREPVEREPVESGLPAPTPTPTPTPTPAPAKATAASRGAAKPRPRQPRGGKKKRR